MCACVCDTCVNKCIYVLVNMWYKPRKRANVTGITRPPWSWMPPLSDEKKGERERERERRKECVITVRIPLFRERNDK